MYILLHLALELTDLLLAQLVITRRELESNQYGPFTSNLTTNDNQARGDAGSNSNVDNSPQTEINRASSNSNGNSSRRNSNRESFPRSRNEMPSTSSAGATYQDNAEDHLLAHEFRHYPTMAERLRRLFNYPRRVSGSSRSDPSTESQDDNPDRLGNGGDSSIGNARNDGNRQSNNAGHMLSEIALSEEVQSIVERIQSSSSIDNDDRSEIRTSSIENRRAASDVGGSDARESETLARTRDHQRSGIMSISEPIDNDVGGGELLYGEVRERMTNRTEIVTPMVRFVESSNRREDSDTEPQTTIASNFRRYLARRMRIDEQRAARFSQQVQRSFLPRRVSPVRETDSARRYLYPLRRDGNADPAVGTHNSCARRRFLHRDTISTLRQEFNVPELQVNSVPVTDLNSFPYNLRRRRSSPPAPQARGLSLFEYFSNFIRSNNNNADGNRSSNDRTNDSTNQSGPTALNNRNRV